MKMCLFFLMMFFFSTSAMSAEPVEAEILDWSACVDLALKYSKDLESYREGVIQSEQAGISARSRLYPQLSASLRGSRSETGDGEDSDSYSYGASLSQLIYDGGKTSSDISSSIIGVEKSKVSYESASSLVRQRLRRSFLGLLRAQEQVSISKSILKRRKQSTDLIILRYKAGREHRGSRMTAEARLAQAEYELARAERNVGLARRQLAEKIGWNTMSIGAVKADLEIAADKAEQDFNRLSELNPALKQLKLEYDNSKLAIKSAKADMIPQVQLSGGATRRDDDWPPDEDSWSLGVSASVPIFEGGRNRAAVRRAEAGERRAAADLISGVNSVVVQLHSQWVQFIDAVEQVEVRHKFLKAAEERASISKAQYSNGHLAFDNWIIIEDDYVSAEKSLLDAQINALNAEADWIYAKGGTLEDEKKK